MRHLLKRHTLPIRAEFEFVLVLTYAFPEKLLEPLLSPGLKIDSWKGLGFVAVAFVQTRRLRPALLPSALGQSFFLSGYRIFCRYTTLADRKLRGLRILRSDTDKRLMKCFGNLLTHYNYHLASVECRRSETEFSLNIQSKDAQGDVSLAANLDGGEENLPEGSPFPDERQARRFAGPMPFTFDYEQQTHSIIRVEGVREEWKPRLVTVDVQTMSFFKQQAYSAEVPVLASSFLIENVPYRWKSGIRERLSQR